MENNAMFTTKDAKFGVTKFSSTVMIDWIG
jgi:hypothetical protein